MQSCNFNSVKYEIRPGATDSLFRVADELILRIRLKKCPIFENAHFWRVLPHGLESQESSIFVLGSVVWCMSGCIFGGKYELKVMKNPCKYNGKQKKSPAAGCSIAIVYVYRMWSAFRACFNLEMLLLL